MNSSSIVYVGYYIPEESFLTVKDGRIYLKNIVDIESGKDFFTFWSDSIDDLKVFFDEYPDLTKSSNLNLDYDQIILMKAKIDNEGFTL